MEIPSQTDYLAVVYAVTLRLAQDAGFQDDEAEQLALCVDEAATNVIEHAYHGLADGRIELSFRDSVGGFSIDLIDHGARIDEDAMPTFDAEQYLEEGRTGGMGVHLMSRIMDAVSYDCDRERNVCRLTKRKSGRARRPGSRRVEARRRILEHLGSGSESDPIACSRLLRLASLVDVFDNLDTGLDAEVALEAVLLAALGSLGSTRGMLFSFEDHALRLRVARGVVRGDHDTRVAERLVREGPGPGVGELGFPHVVPVGSGRRILGFLLVGPSSLGVMDDLDEHVVLEAVATCAEALLERESRRRDRKRLEMRISAQRYQLQSLLDLSRELATSFDEQQIKGLLTSTLMGHLMVSRCALYLRDGPKVSLALERGTGRGDATCSIDEAESMRLVAILRGTVPVARLPPSAIRERVESTRMRLVVPLRLGDSVEGFIAVGDKIDGSALSDEDIDFVKTIGSETLAALTGARMQKVRVEKERQDRELQLAREIQESLFPESRPSIPGFELAAESRACYEVGGDYYDYFTLDGERMAVAVADVSGKGAGASLLMASVRAWLRARAGSGSPAEVVASLNQFLLESTQLNKYVTLFYGELDPATRTLRYVNAGHVPPFVMNSEGGRSRLEEGGPVLGVIDGVVFEEGTVELKRGDLLAVVTDGVTEAEDSEGTQFGEPRVFEETGRSPGVSAEEALRALRQAVEKWAGPVGCSDDVTLLMLKAP